MVVLRGILLHRMILITYLFIYAQNKSFGDGFLVQFCALPQAGDGLWAKSEASAPRAMHELLHLSQEALEVCLAQLLFYLLWWDNVEIPLGSSSTIMNSGTSQTWVQCA